MLWSGGSLVHVNNQDCVIVLHSDRSWGRGHTCACRGAFRGGGGGGIHPPCHNLPPPPPLENLASHSTGLGVICMQVSLLCHPISVCL